MIPTISTILLDDINYLWIQKYVSRHSHGCPTTPIYITRHMMRDTFIFFVLYICDLHNWREELKLHNSNYMWLNYIPVNPLISLVQSPHDIHEVDVELIDYVLQQNYLWMWTSTDPILTGMKMDVPMLYWEYLYHTHYNLFVHRMNCARLTQCKIARYLYSVRAFQNVHSKMS